MSIAWNAFTPAAALIGGAIIGAAVALFVVLNGRIAGVSGILGGLARPQAGDISWRGALLAGPIPPPPPPPPAPPGVPGDTRYPLLGAAGVLVGGGTRYRRGGAHRPPPRRRCL